MKSVFTLKLVTLIAVMSLYGCFVYKVDVQQGNDFTAEMLSKIEIGMTKREITQIAGYPLINDPFHKDRWDYYYSKRDGKTGAVEQRSATLFFKDDLLSKVTSTIE